MQTKNEFQMEETKKRKLEVLGADKESPAKMPVTKTDSESEDFLSNTVNSANPCTSASDKKHRSLGLSKTTVLCSQSTDL